MCEMHEECEAEFHSSFYSLYLVKTNKLYDVPLFPRKQKAINLPRQQFPWIENTCFFVRLHLFKFIRLKTNVLLKTKG